MVALKVHALNCASSGYVFLDEGGKPFARTRFYRRWCMLLKAAGLPHYHFHSCRHTMATRLLRQGCYLTARFAPPPALQARDHFECIQFHDPRGPSPAGRCF
ncbi:MAG: tyrosine-type recombinase/integrase [Candidatus Eremiobacteraeota bacterium]|nr:tyrosine-type recombinase/integrase [Candidatus Eremiobacteraeota bacterium]